MAKATFMIEIMSWLTAQAPSNSSLLVPYFYHALNVPATFQGFVDNLCPCSHGRKNLNYKMRR